MIFIKIIFKYQNWTFRRKKLNQLIFFSFKQSHADSNT